MKRSIMSSRELFISSPRWTCADASGYVRSLLCGCIDWWFHGGAVLKFD